MAKIKYSKSQIKALEDVKQAFKDIMAINLIKDEDNLSVLVESGNGVKYTIDLNSLEKRKIRAMLNRKEDTLSRKIIRMYERDLIDLTDEELAILEGKETK